MDPKSKDSKTLIAVAITLFVGAIGVIGVGMYYSATYPFPGGKSLDLVEFVSLWLREIVILILATVAVLIAIIRWFSRRFRAQDKNAL
jgi:cell division protein FtsW (lipid II flippase)